MGFATDTQSERDHGMSPVEEYASSIDVDLIRQEITDLLPRLALNCKTLTNVDQLCLHGTHDGDSPLHGVGKIGDLLPFLETDFTENLFVEHMPYTYKVLDSLKACRMRIMGMAPRRCYSYHQDESKRIHIPIVTHRKCFLAFEDGLHHLPANGSYYVVDTTRPHSAFNGSQKCHRVHLVGVFDD